MTALVALAAMLSAQAQAAEGLWTFDHAPIDKIRAETGAVVDQAWLDHLRNSAVRLSSGWSASVVSSDGLVATNHHCVAGCEGDLSAAGRDYVKDGFLTAKREDERLCPGMDAEVLISITDITSQITAATAGKSGKDYSDARNLALTRAEQAACGADAKFRCEALAFFGGRQFKLHRYRRYADVRLVFAPEDLTANFGGDPDNFNFPRFCLDVAFLRLYDGGRPLATPEHLTWSTAAPQAGEPVFTAGNPGSSDRAMTMAQLADARDIAFRVSQLQLSEYRGRLIQFGETSPEAHRVAYDQLFGTENAFKGGYGRDLSLYDRSFIASKQAQEDELRARVRANPALAARIGDPWADIDKAQKVRYLAYRELENAAGNRSDLFTWARQLVRGARERAKPEADRLPAFAPSRLASLQRQVLDNYPVHRGIEQVKLEFWLLKLREYLTVDDPAARQILGNESPERLAARLSSSNLTDPALRKQLWEGGVPAIEASTDPMIVFLRRIDELGVAQQKAWSAEVVAPIEQAQARIGEARFAVYGDTLYPDANFTLRLSYGKVEGWTRNGQTVAPTTNFAGLLQRAQGDAPFTLAPRWQAARSKLNPATVLNFSSSNDILGGNSGSPIVNAKGEIIGLVFDGNIYSLGGTYGYDPVLNRGTSVATVAITEALDKVYGESALVAELTRK